jgi:hypothetical protein
VSRPRAPANTSRHGGAAETVGPGELVTGASVAGLGDRAARNGPPSPTELEEQSGSPPGA